MSMQLPKFRDAKQRWKRRSCDRTLTQDDRPCSTAASHSFILLIFEFFPSLYIDMPRRNNQAGRYSRENDPARHHVLLSTQGLIHAAICTL